MNLFVAQGKEPFLFQGLQNRRGHLPLNITRQTDLLLPKDSFVFVTKLRASAQNQQALQSGFLYHNLQIIVSVRKSCSGDCRCCLQTVSPLTDASIEAVGVVQLRPRRIPAGPGNQHKTPYFLSSSSSVEMHVHS